MPPPGRPITVAIAPTIVQLRQTPAGVLIFVGAQQVPMAAVSAAALASMLAAEPALTPEDARANGRVFVRADLDVGYRNVVDVVDTLEHARFERVAIASQNADARG